MKTALALVMLVGLVVGKWMNTFVARRFCYTFMRKLTPLQSVAAEEVRHIELGNELLVETSPTYFALKATNLIENNYLTWVSKSGLSITCNSEGNLLTVYGLSSVSINGAQITVIPGDCKIIRDNIRQVNQNTWSLIEESRAKLAAVEKTYPDAQVERSVSKYELGGPKSHYSSSTSSARDFEYNGFAFSKVNDLHFTVRRIVNSAGLNRIFVDDDTVTFVGLDGQVLMKPNKCLSEQETRFISQLRYLMKRAEKGSESSWTCLAWFFVYLNKSTWGDTLDQIILADCMTYLNHQ